MAPLGTQISYALKARGVDVVFGIPGVHNQELYRGLEEAGLRHILARHEQGAGFMADGYARATGRAGVAFVITGPGLCNIMTALGQAYSDSVPLLVFSSCLDDIETRKGQLHQMKDQLAAAATVCDWSELAQSDAQVYRLMDQAFAEFAQQRPRPKHIQIPITSLAAAAQAAPAAQPLPRAPAPVAGDIAKAAEMLRLAKKPLVILGGGARAVSVMPLLQQLDAASFTTYAGRGVVDRAYPLHFGSLLARSGAKSVLGSADLVLVIGSELSEGDLWRAELGHKAPLIRVDLDPEVLTDSHQAELAIQMRAEAFVPALLSQLQGHKAQTVWRAQEIQTQRRALAAASGFGTPRHPANLSGSAGCAAPRRNDLFGYDAICLSCKRNLADVETGPLASSDRIWNFGICAARCYWRCDWSPRFADGGDYRRLRISIFPAGIGRCS
jgi:acetolactate synthase-1/2/3 large subunit/5-guanidino-2-oxopentanoate decarboxylase